MSNFEQILREIGEFGFYQKRMVAVLCIPYLLINLDLFSQIFAGISFPHQCNTDWILDHRPNLTDVRKRNLTIPVNNEGRFESCEMFTPVDLDLETIEKYGINTTTKCTNGFNFETSKGASSIVTEFDLVCDRSSFIPTSQCVYMCGFLFGAFVAGQLADRFGRRCVVLHSVFFLMLFGVATGFSPNIYVYMVFRFLSAICTSSILGNAFVIAGEWSDSSKFAHCTIICQSFTAVGLMILSGTAYFIHNWRVLHVVLYSPDVVVLAILYWSLPESARWLLTQGRKEEAIKEVQRAAKVNKRNVPEHLLEKLDFEGTSRGTMLDIFRLPYLRKRVLIMNCVWFATSLMYYGVSLNVGSLGPNIYLTQFLFGLVEFPGRLCILPLLQRFGRRYCQAVILLIGGLSCTVIIFIPRDFHHVITAVAILGKFTSSASFATVFVYSGELYPTTLRQNGVGLNSMSARVAGILTPLILLLEVYHYSLPMLIYGTVPIVAGGLCLLLPETLNTELQDHAEIPKSMDGTTKEKGITLEDKSGKSTKM